MALLACIDPAAPQPSRVLGFYDTEAFAYPTLPDNLVPMTPGQWAARMERGYFQDGAFVAPPPPPPAAVLAAALRALGFELATRQAAGMPFTLASGQAVTVGTAPAQQVANGHAAMSGVLLTADGTPVPCSAADAAAVLPQVGAYLLAVTRRYAELHAAVLADPASDITVGWPSGG